MNLAFVALIIIAIVLAIIFCFIAFFAWSVSYNRFRLGTVALYLGAIGMILMAGLMIYYGYEAWDRYNYNALYQYGSRYILWGLFFVAIIGIILAVVGVIVNLTRLGPGYFYLGFAALVLLVAVVCINGFNLRYVYQGFTDGYMDKSCMRNLRNVNRNDIL